MLTKATDLYHLSIKRTKGMGGIRPLPHMMTTKVKNTLWQIGLIDKAVVRNSRRRKTNLNVALISF